MLSLLQITTSNQKENRHALCRDIADHPRQHVPRIRPVVESSLAPDAASRARTRATGTVDFNLSPSSAASVSAATRKLRCTATPFK
jgi:hypothetical protein